MNLLRTVQQGCEAACSRTGCQRFRACLPNALLMLSIAVVSGCATPALWKHTAAKSWSPQGSPDEFLAVTTAGQEDVVVVFRQFARVGEDTKYRVVAWKLGQPTTELAIGRHALRQLTNACDRVQAMPSFTTDTVPTEATSTSPGYAVKGPLDRQFTVHLEGVPAGPFELPVSKEGTRLLRRAGLLPFSATADAVIATGAFCLLGAGGAVAVGH